MLRSLNAGISGLQQFQQRMDLIGNNIANVNTTGYKAARADFSDAFSQTLRSSSPGTDATSSVGSMQIGSGVKTASITNLYNQGALNRTDIQTDLAVSGNGFFIVRDPRTNEEFATRAGDFHLDQNRFLVTNNGLRVQGFSDSGLTTTGDIQIDAVDRPGGGAADATLSSFSIDREGRINVRLSDNREYTRGQILLQRFNDPQALMKQGDNLYAGLISAGALPEMAAPNTNGLGTIESGALELSNVDLATEFAGLITNQRAFQANARIISTSDEVLQELVNLKR